jgi:cyanate permease
MLTLAFPANSAVVYLLGRYSMKATLLIAAFLLLAGNWIRYAGTRTQNFGVTMFGQILIGFSQPFVLSAPPHYSDLWFTSRGRVSATAVASLSNPFGAALGQFLNPMFANRAEKLPDMVLYVAIIASVSILGWTAFPARPPSPPGPSGNTTKATASESLKALRSNREFWLIWIMFTVYLGLFNAFTTLLNQIMLPRGYSIDDAGITGALLILAGLVCSAIVSPIIDRTHSYFLALRIAIPLLAVCYVAFVFAPSKGIVAAPWVVAAVLGAASFCLLPLALELSVEFTHPVAPEWSSSLLWCGGQLLGAVLILVMDATKIQSSGDMKWALVLQAVLACVVVPLAFFAGGMNMNNNVLLRRLEMDQSV